MHSDDDNENNDNDFLILHPLNNLNNHFDQAEEEGEGYPTMSNLMLAGGASNTHKGEK